ncbi:hypothetical protein [Marinifilum sp.]|uniref:hypothetical protein n=1 Tax=Marinifilum sp. TaxID=2033137 RepID=UPI003BAD1B62
MSNTDQYAALKDKIEAIKDESIVAITMPVNIYLQEAEDMARCAKIDTAELATINVSEEQVDDLQVRIGACRQVQSLWVDDQHKTNEAEDTWADIQEQANELKSELIHTFRYAFRKDESALSAIADIAEGRTNSDTIQDLNDLSVVGKGNTEALTAINFDISKLDTAADIAVKGADALAVANGSRQRGSDTKVLRDKAYTYLKEAVDDIRAAGKFLFRNDPKKLKGYTSKYWKKKNSTARKVEDVETLD